MELPDLSDVVEDWTRPRTVKTVTRETVDFEPVDVVTARTVEAMIQPADPRKIQKEEIDWSKRYILIHALSDVQIDELVEYNGEDHRVFSTTGWQEYGFNKAIAESTNEPLREPTT